MTSPADITATTTAVPLAEAAKRRPLPICGAVDCDIPMNLRLSVATGLCCCHREGAHKTDPTCVRCRDLLTIDDPDGDLCARCVKRGKR